MPVRRSEILIERPIEQVWTILSDFPLFSVWNPYLIYLRGQAQAGARAKAILRPPGERTKFLRMRLQQFERNRLRLKGCWYLPILLTIDMDFQLHEHGQDTRVDYHESWSGLIPRFFWNRLEWAVKTGGKQMLQALKKIIEE